MLKIEIQTDNDAFYDDALAPELAHILRNLADGLEHSGAEKGEGVLKDMSGNKVGTWVLDGREGDN